MFFATHRLNLKTDREILLLYRRSFGIVHLLFKRFRIVSCLQCRHQFERIPIAAAIIPEISEWPWDSKSNQHITSADNAIVNRKLFFSSLPVVISYSGISGCRLGSLLEQLGSSLEIVCHQNFH
jgi:hypothetical protein